MNVLQCHVVTGRSFSFPACVMNVWPVKQIVTREIVPGGGSNLQ